MYRILVLFLISVLLTEVIQAKPVNILSQSYNDGNNTPYVGQLNAEKVKSNYFDKMGWQLREGTFGFSAIFSGKRTTNTDIDLIFAGVDELVQKSLGINASVGYFIKDNFSVGISGGYLQSDYQLKANILQNFLSRDIQNNIRRYSINPFIKNYISLSYRNIIYITNQTELNLQQEQGIYTTLVNKDAGLNIPLPGLPAPQQVIERKDSRIINLGFRIRPGILVFLAPRFAFESNLSVFGFNYKIEQLTYDYPDEKPSINNIKNNVTNKSATLDFKLDFLNFGFGFAYFL